MVKENTKLDHPPCWQGYENGRHFSLGETMFYQMMAVFPAGTG
jgi:hypothetical protein